MTDEEDLARPSIATQAAVAACGVFAFLNVYATQPLLPMLGRIYSVSKVELGLTVSAATTGLALSAPLFGVLAENSERRRVIVASMFLLALVTLAVAMAPNISVLIAWRFLQGIILPGVFTGVVALINEQYHGKHVSQLMRTYVSGTVFGGFCGRFITGEMASYFGWRSGFFVLSGLTLLGSVFLAMTLTKGRPKQIAGNSSVAGHLVAFSSNLLNLRLLALCFVGFSLLSWLVATFTYVTYYLASPPFLLSTGQLSWLFAVYLFGLVTTPASALLLHRVDTRWTLIAALILSMAGILITLVHSLAIIVLGLILCSSGVFIGQAASLGHLRYVTDQRRAASAPGLYFAFYYLGGTAGGVLPGYFWKLGGWGATVVFILAMQAMTVVAIVFGLRTVRNSGLWSSTDQQETPWQETA